jgi:hypothetical protein
MVPLAVAASSNDMIPGGCTTRATCTNAVAGSDLQSFYAAHDVTAATLHDAVKGTVESDGKVLVNGQVVATGAQSYGRTFLPGSTQDGPVYRRSVSVSFQSSSLAALVYESNGRFVYAILESCGNLVTATPVVPVAPKPAPKPVSAPKPVVQPTATPRITNVNNNVNVVEVQNQPPAVTPAATPAPAPTPATTTAASTPAPAPAPAAAPAAALPQTGASTFGLVGLAALLTFSRYYLRSRRGLRWALLANKIR